MKPFFRALLWLSTACVSLSTLAGVNTWTEVGPDGGPVRKIIFHPTNPEVLFALTFSGAYRSLNSGESWQRVYAFPITSNYPDLDIDPANPNHVYLTGVSTAQVSDDGGATFSLLGNPLSDARGVEISADGAVTYLATSDRIYRSIDHGTTWSLQGQVPGVTTGIDSFFIDPADAGTLYALAFTDASARGVFLSEDGGVTWQLVESVDAQHGTAIEGLALSANPRRLWTARAGGVHLSTDKGRSSLPVSSSILANAIAVDRAKPDTLYVADAFGKVFRSDDAGLQWTEITSNLAVGQGATLAQHPQRLAEIYIGGSDLARTTNGGTSWSARHAGIRSARISSLSTNPARGRTYINSSVGGVHYFESGANFASEVNNTALRQAMNGFRQWPFPTALHAQEGTPGRLYVALTNDVLRSPDGGNTWQFLVFPTTGNNNIYAFASSPRAPDVIYAETADSGVLRSVDAGDHWTPINTGLPTNAVMTRLVAAASDKSFVYGTPTVLIQGPIQSSDTYGVYRWNETALRWDPANTGMETAAVYDLVVHPTDPQLVLAVTNTAIMKSTNGGSSWTALSWDGTFFGGSLVKVAFDPLDSRIIYAAYDAHMIRSIDGGASWETLSDSTASVGARLITALVADPGAPGSLIAGTAGLSARQFTIAPDLALQIQGSATAASGESLSYDLTVLNIGPYHATGVQVTIHLPPGTTGIGAEPPSNCTVVTSTVNCPLDLLRVGSSSKITLHATPESTGTFAVAAEISGAQEDAALANNNANASTTVEMQSDLSISATGSPTAEVGAAVTYTMTVKNAGPNTASSAKLNVALASGLSNANATTTRGTCTSSGSQLTCDLGNLASTETATITINATASTAGKQDSTASVSSGSTDPASANNSAMNSTTVSAPTSAGNSSTSTGGGGGGALSRDVLFVLALLALARLWGRSRSSN